MQIIRTVRYHVFQFNCISCSKYFNKKNQILQIQGIHLVIIFKNNAYQLIKKYTLVLEARIIQISQIS